MIPDAREPVPEPTDEEICRLERVASASWPPLEEVLFGGWCVGSSGAYTRRANCVSPHGPVPPGTALVQRIEEVEAHYAARARPPVFKMTQAAQPEELDAALEARGYERHSETLVMVLPGGARSPEAGEANRVVEGRFERFENVFTPAWLEASCLFSKVPSVRRSDYEAILGRLRTQGRGCAFGAWFVEDRIRSVALGVLVEGITSFHQVATDPDMRGRGYASRVLRGLLESEMNTQAAPAGGAEPGPPQRATSAMLSVEAENAAARRLYDRLGFREVYRLSLIHI